eukprot:364273-Chlamydomonas_euryale.AAC.1
MEWELEDVISMVEPHLTPSRVSECTKATRLLVAACGYVMSHGTLRFQGSKVTSLFKMVANVAPGDFTGGARKRGHWWMHVRFEKDGGYADMDVDLTARQFYRQLTPRFMGDPRLPPMKAQMKSPTDTEYEEGMERECGTFPEPVNEYSSAQLVLVVFKSAEEKSPGLVDTMRVIYRRLGAVDIVE